MIHDYGGSVVSGYSKVTKPTRGGMDVLFYLLGVGRCFSHLIYTPAVSLRPPNSSVEH